MFEAFVNIPLKLNYDCIDVDYVKDFLENVRLKFVKAPKIMGQLLKDSLDSV